MQEFELGPNGAMLYCLEYLEKNVDWLMEKVQGLGQKYLIFDFPGQVRILYVVRPFPRRPQRWMVTHPVTGHRNRRINQAQDLI